MGTNLTTYLVENMRVTRPGTAAAQRHPERVFTVAGKFYATKPDAKGNPVRDGEPLSIPSKNVDRDDILAEGFSLDPVAGILTVPAGERGRKASEGLSPDAILAELNALRGDAS